MLPSELLELLPVEEAPTRAAPERVSREPSLERVKSSVRRMAFGEEDLDACRMGKLRGEWRFAVVDAAVRMG